MRGLLMLFNAAVVLGLSGALLMLLLVFTALGPDSKFHRVCVRFYDWLVSWIPRRSDAQEDYE